jgi:hypothetical protein
VNAGQVENELKRALRHLVAEADKAWGPEGVAPFAGLGEEVTLEHTTRRLFLDGMLKALGWSLGPGGDVAEEARVKAETTTFMDYVGVSRTRVPLLIVEAKAWEKPFVAPARGSNAPSEPPHDLIVRAIAHLRAGGAPPESPVIGLWHGYLDQVLGYVRDVRNQHGHEVARVVLTSGQWLVVFVEPVATFLGPAEARPDQVLIFHKADYVAASGELLAAMGQAALADMTPTVIRPSQLPTFAPAGQIKATFLGLHVFHDEQRNRFSGPHPLVRCTPIVIVQRRDGKVIAVMDESERRSLPQGDDGLEAHVAEIALGSGRLVTACTDSLGVAVRPEPLTAFPGFSDVVARRRDAEVTLTAAPRAFVQLQPDGDEWLMVTGLDTHFLAATATAGACPFHRWAAGEAQGVALGTGAIGRPSVEPRSYYIDGQAHHCAHQGVQDLRAERCHLAGLDSRLCCLSCVYRSVCWSPTDRAPVACPR